MPIWFRQLAGVPQGSAWLPVFLFFLLCGNFTANVLILQIVNTCQSGWPPLLNGQVWTVVRTKFIDDVLSAVRGVQQMVNLGAGVDTRPYRLDIYKEFKASFEVDTTEVPAAYLPHFPTYLDFEPESSACSNMFKQVPLES